MNKEQRRLDAFSYFLYKLLEVIKEKKKYKNILDALLDTNRATIFRLLYLTCIQSVDLEDLKSYNDIGLFEIFNPFYAYNQGPIQPSIYYSLEILKGYEYKDGEFIYINESKLPILEKELKEQIDSAVENLSKNADIIIKSIDKKTDRLIVEENKLLNLCYSFPSFIFAHLYIVNKQIESDNPTYIKADIEKYREFTS